MSRPRLCLHCKKPIAPHRGRPSDYCKPAHKLAYKAAHKPARPRRGRKAARAVAAKPPAGRSVDLRKLRGMVTAAVEKTVAKLERRLDRIPVPRKNARPAAPVLDLKPLTGRQGAIYKTFLALQAKASKRLKAKLRKETDRQLRTWLKQAMAHIAKKAKADAKAAPAPIVPPHEHSQPDSLTAISRLEARLLVLEERPAAREGAQRHFEISGESLALGPVSPKHVPPSVVLH